MEKRNECHLQPIEGKIIRDSLLKLLGWILFGLVILIPAGGGLVWAWWTEASFAGHKITWYGAILGAVGFLVGILIVPVGVFSVFRRSRLILGEDCFQYVVGNRKVTAQIPYKNIARMELIQNQGGDSLVTDFIGIDLHDVNDPKTFCPTSETAKGSWGWHYRLTDAPWVMPLAQIHDRLRKRLPPKEIDETSRFS
jgi:hypothetical protein